ncbi:hypothetical protein [Pseudobacteriovorax antillogorgiicola]|uniref:DUF5683 domain-containing protein n=1 Tax=Pseudobacteriovorax antillogorgiicola TaxID=1513793 RepID=A0A1Y6CHU9_9BACT|nr:hypothetical protein [Pseudobacteriovorax antillogorgiicola]TCS47015.1 hypothetical protein EDD56_122110 [Pseudobacteriovorax antillogorgiicola]SMF65140.1 hypothetical protein SAMN06296036_122110 [Pseudobacteriovorax antillogorgiicola]
MYSSLIRYSLILLFAGAKLYGQQVTDDEKWQEFIRAEQERSRADLYNVKLIGGLAATGFGLWGAFFDRGDLITQVTYTAFHTGGILSIKESLRDHYQPSHLLLDHHFLEYKGSPEELRRKIVQLKELQRANASRLTMYSNLTLGTIYLLSGKREYETNSGYGKSLYFLGFNFLLSAGLSGLDLIEGGQDLYPLEKFDYRFKPELEWSLLPLPKISYKF